MTGRPIDPGAGMTFAQVLERMYDSIDIPESRQPLFRRDVWLRGMYIRNCPRCGVILACRLHEDGTVSVEDRWLDDYDGLFADDWTEVRA